jgi:Fe-S cluster assembly protein SufD
MQNPKHNWIAETREEARQVVTTMPEPVLKYGLNVFFTAKDVRFPFESAAAPGQTLPAVKAPEGVTVMPLADALGLEKYEPLLKELFTAEDGRTPKVSAWHRANAGVGLLIHVPKNFSPEGQVRIDVALTDAVHASNVVVLAEEGSAVTVVERTYSPERRAKDAIRSAVTDIIAMPGAKVTHIAVQDIADDATEFSARRARVERDATVEWIDCVFGGRYSQLRSSTALAGEGASVKHRTAFFGNAEQKLDLRQEVRHLAPRTHSDIKGRGALADASKAVYRGLVRIEKGAVGSSGFQKEDVLLLGERAEVDAIPDLEINTDDVRCGHGAAIGRMDKERLFYLMSRGLDETAAKKMLVEGFFADLFGEMRDAGLEDMAACLVAGKVDGALKSC